MTCGKFIQPNLEYVEAHRAFLRQHYAGQWVLLHQGTLIGAWDTVQDAQRHARALQLTQHMILYVDESR